MDIKIEIGQKWREVDPRFTRILTVVDFIYGADSEVSRVVIKNAKGHITRAMPSRFNGKRGGYELVSSY